VVRPLGIDEYLKALIEPKRGNVLMEHGLLFQVDTSIKDSIFTAYGDLMYLDINNANMSISNTSTILFDVARRTYGRLTSSGTCTACSNSDCLLCLPCLPETPSFTSYCTVCNTSNPSTTCVATTTCPIDYYSFDGICFKCPVGCSACNSGSNCTSCDSGLSLVTNSTATVCACPAG